MEVICKEVAHGSQEYDNIVALRNDLLRKPLGLVFSKEDLAKEKDSFHLGAYVGGELVACLILLPLSNGTLKMRQVATASKHQGKGYGRELVKFSEEFSKEKGYQKIELNAREIAIPFYEKLAYDKEGGIFEEVGIPHQKMFKRLF